MAVIGYVLVLVIAFLLAVLLTPASMTLAWRLALVDRPGGRRRHQGVIPRIGGLALFGGFFGAVLFSQALPAGWLPPSTDPNEARRLAGLLVGTAFMAGFGLLDDRFEFGNWPQYLAQAAAGVISILFVIFIERANNPFGPGQIVFPGPLVWLLTVLWFMGAINTVNWLDGMDGLAAMVAGIVAVVLALHMLRSGQGSVAPLALALLGCTAGFLIFNWPPARVFMGSVGAYFLGYTLAALGLIAGARVATVLLVIGLPALDVAWLMWQRWRRGQPVGQGDRDHLHFRLLAKGYSPRQILMGYGLFCGLFGLASLSSNTLVKLGALLALLLAGGGVIWWASPRGADDHG